ncbi:glycoside hydrolase family 140 protein [Bacteroides sp.]|uniref:glycoside hydrolase family 140 protein n=1 Tax=Bacteroides sp. TaxID=29523 RepID=UPI002A8284A6|nr:glycoside hydrolase family 140 protein [Bacteroides sp.]
MKKILLIIYSLGILLLPIQAKFNVDLPWSNGKLIVSDEGRYLRHENGVPFFWLGETGWLMPERLNRDEVRFYLQKCKQAGYNVVQVQTINAVPAMNVYGKYSMVDGFVCNKADHSNEYGYWEHMDYIIKIAEENGIYVGLVCIWGGLVKGGLMNVEQAKSYGKFLAERYKNAPNIVWIIGGDIRGDIKTEVWETLAYAIKSIDRNHLMTFHPFGRTVSTTWFNNADWLDFNMFQSGHRRYGQRKGDGDYTIQDNTEEDNWRFVEYSLSQKPLKPVLDAEPSYEDIPQGLHDIREPRWTATDVRRYAYWSVFAGACGHTYGNNNIMQFYRPGLVPSYGANRAWWHALEDAGFNQMQYLKNLILAFPYFERIPDQTIISGQNGERYDRVIATRGEDYLLVYNHTGCPMEIDLDKISGEKKNVWWYSPKNGSLKYVGEYDSKITRFYSDTSYARDSDRVLIAVDINKEYISKYWNEILVK